MTQIGNSAWSLMAGLLIWLVARLTRGGTVGCDATALRRVETVALFVVASVALSGVIANLAKTVIGRARPMTEQGGVFDFAPLTFHHSWASFPSGHATTALAFATCLAMIWPRHGVAWLACGVFVALTRAFIGAHWMSDVVAGAVLGVLVPVVLWPRFCRRPLRPLLPPRILRLATTAMGQAVQRLVAAAPASLTDVLDWRRQD
jgi:membrane-associated phospholipid phosphatase